MGGVVYGGEALSPNVSGAITWQVEETDIYTGFQTLYTFTLNSGIQLPSYAVYALINNIELNLSVSSTVCYTPPLGSLYVASKIGAGLLAPIYISGNQQYTGAYVTPSGGNLPILPGDLGPEQQWPLGSSLQNQTAEIDLGTIVSTLAFYSNDLPGVGTRIRLQTWESQAAVTHLQNAASVSGEAAVVGDDGIRSSIVTDMQPIPRTSEDCDVAAQAYLYDRVNPFYQGTYTASYLFFDQLTNDIEFYPCCGRYLFLNAPQRGFNKYNAIVTAITTTISELAGEIMDHAISFGPDLHLEKVMADFVSQPANVLLPQDTVVTLTPQQIAQIEANNAYIADVVMSRFDTLAMTGETASLLLQDTMPINAFYELRNEDLNWGVADSGLIARYYDNDTVVLPRAVNGYEQVWYIRFVNPTGGPNNTTALSRRSKVLRLYWPQIPSVPAYLYADSETINVDFNGDIRNIEGIELRDGTDTVAYYDGIVGSEFDMQLSLGTLRGQLQAGVSVVGGPVGSYMLGTVPATERSFTIHFFNLMWEYSPGLSVYIPPPSAPVISEGYRWGPALQINVSSTPRTDIQYTTLQLATLNQQIFRVATPILDYPSSASIESIGSGVITAYSPAITGFPNSSIYANGASGALAVQFNGYADVSRFGGATFEIEVSVDFGNTWQVWNTLIAPQAEYTQYTSQYITLPLPSASGAYNYNASAVQVRLLVAGTRGPGSGVTQAYGSITDAYVISTLDPFFNAIVPATGSFNFVGSSGIFYQAQQQGAVASFNVNIQVTGAVCARAQFADYISSGSWSNECFIPQGDLIASDYLAGQGSVPPAITNANGTSGGIFTYATSFVSGNAYIEMFCRLEI
jgi:hypothetical protein